MHASAIACVPYRVLLPWGYVYVSPVANAYPFGVGDGNVFVPTEGFILTYSVQYQYSFVPTEAFAIRYGERQPLIIICVRRGSLIVAGFNGDIQNHRTKGIKMSCIKSTLDGGRKNRWVA